MATALLKERIKDEIKKRIKKKIIEALIKASPLLLKIGGVTALILLILVLMALGINGMMGMIGGTSNNQGGGVRSAYPIDDIAFRWMDQVEWKDPATNSVQIGLSADQKIQMSRLNVQLSPSILWALSEIKPGCNQTCVEEIAKLLYPRELEFIQIGIEQDNLYLSKITTYEGRYSFNYNEVGPGGRPVITSVDKVEDFTVLYEVMAMIGLNRDLNSWNAVLDLSMQYGTQSDGVNPLAENYAKKLGLVKTSGYRSPEESVRVGGNTNDDHTKGIASDFAGPQDKMNEFAIWAVSTGKFTKVIWQGRDLISGVAISGHYDHVHVSWKEGGNKSALPSEELTQAIINAIAITSANTPGVDASWLAGMQQLVMRESTGNPMLVNPVSVFYSSQHGYQHATGLCQLMPPTFEANKLPGYDDIFNPLDNIIASIRYIRGKYGTVNDIPRLYDEIYPGY